ncbi:MAG TPA: TetR/AcrR family transcriptional regulator [Deltaproteobacteria bacterium]|mgnify:CR=1 FL=1|jgi:AcrR family transcriptional regulator|nr:TetR/AcrR family transcriptional regulator [Deltaproteobacteria bacterium]HOI07243.1 TetR/AcrR family transcriptional regulator [Deltaproteobacteria bacterium]
MNREEKLAAIYEAALRVFARYGYRRTRVEDIADELGMTKGNLYLYVENKRDLYEKAVAHGLSRWQEMVVKAIEKVDDVVEQFLVMCKKSYSYLARDVSLRTVLVNDPSVFPLSSKEDPFSEINRASMRLLSEVIRKGIRQGRFREVEVDQVAELLYSVYVMFIIKTYVKSEGKSTQKLFEQGLDIILHGLLKK